MPVDPAAMANEAAASHGRAATAREVEVLLSANTGAFQEEMKKAGSAAGSVADALYKVEKALQTTLKRMGVGLMGLGAAFQGVATSAAWSAAKFEESFARVAKTTGLQNTQGQFLAAFGIGDDLQSFANDIRQLSTEIPVAVGELAHLADVAGQLGVESDNLVLYAESAASLGAAITGLSSEQAVMGLTNLIEAFGDAPETITNLGSSLADLANHTRGSANEMLYFSDRLAGVAVRSNMTSEEVLGLGAAVSAVGQGPQLGASAIEQFLSQVSLAVQTGNDDLDKFATVIGVTREELKALWNEGGGTDVLQKFLQALNRQGQQATVTLEQLGLNARGTSQVLGALAGQIGVVNDALGTAAESYEAGESLEELAKIRFDTVIKSLQRFRQSVAEVWRSLGVGFLPMMKMVINAASNFVNTFNALPQPIKTAMGLFTGLTGVVLTLAGAYVLLVGRLFPFLTAISGVQMGLSLVSRGFTAASAAMMRFAGVETVSNVSRLSTVLATLGGALGRVPAVAGRAAAALGTTLLTSLKTMVGWTRTATTAVFNLLRAWVAHDMHTLNSMLAGMGRRILGVGKSATTAALGVGALSVSMSTLMLATGGVIALVAAVGWALSKLGNDADHAALGMKELAKATGMAWQELDAFSDSIQVEKTFAEQARGMVNEIQRIRDELGQAAAERYMFNYGMILSAMGNSPEQVTAQIEELSRLSDTPIRFKYMWEQIAPEGGGVGPGAEEGLRGFASGIGMLFDDKMSLSPFAFSHDLPEDFQAQYSAYLEGMRAVVGDSVAKRIAVGQEIQRELDKAHEEGLIGYNFWQELNEQAEAFGFAPEVTDESGWWRRNLGRPAMSGINELFGWTDTAEQARASRSSAGQLDMQGALARSMDEPWAQNVDEWERIRELVSEVTGETENLHQAIIDMSAEDFTELTRQIGDLGVQMEREAKQVRLADPNITNLQRLIDEGPAGMTLDEQSMDRYRKHVYETYQHQVGHVQALREASTWLESLVGTQDEWGERAEELRNMIKTVGDEFSQMRIKDLDQELNAMGAAESVRYLQKEIRTLQSLGVEESAISGAVDEMMNRMQQARQEQVQQFRQMMDEYDRLLDQREELERSHAERLVEMEEDRNESIAEARESHQEQMEELAEREEEALERRVRAQAEAFDATEALESQHAQSAARLNANMERQNRAMATAQSSLARLRQMGLGNEVIEALGLNDPRNVDQLERMVQDAVANPALIDQINSTWARRLDLSEAFVDETDALDEEGIRSDFAEQRREAERELDERIAEINENYSEQVAEANERHAQQIEKIGEALAALGNSTAKTVEELVDQAMESGLGGLQRWAQEIEKVQDEINDFTAQQQERATDLAESYKSISDSVTNWADTVAEHPYVAAHPYVQVTPPEPAPSGARNRRMADGGLLPDEATIRRGGTLVQWAEPETGGEAFIPLAPGKRERSRSIWMQTGELLGIDVSRVAMANGGTLGTKTTGREPVGMSQSDVVGALVKALETSGPSQSHETNYGPIEVKATDARDLVRQLEARKRRSRLVGKKVHDG